MPELASLPAGAAFSERDAIKQRIGARIAERTTQDWLTVLEPADIWCASVLDWPGLLQSEGFRLLDMVQTVTRDDGVAVRTTRSPIRVDGRRAITPHAAPRIGQHSDALRREFGI